MGEGGEEPIIPAISMESLGGGVYAGTVVDPINVEILVGEKAVTFKAASGTTFTTSEDWSGVFESVDMDLSAEISGLINSAVLVEFNSGLNSSIMLSKPILISFEYPGVVSLTNRVMLLI